MVLLYFLQNPGPSQEGHEGIGFIAGTLSQDFGQGEGWSDPPETLPPWSFKVWAFNQ